MAASEMTPFAATGGLGDVLAALPPALAALGARVHVVLPAYRTATIAGADTSTYASLLVPHPDGVREIGLRTLRHRDVAVSFVVADDHFARDGLYGDAHGDYGDNAARFAFYAHAVAALAARLDPPPDVVHCHDWQAGLVPALLRTADEPRLAGLPTVFTIHNLGYQGIFGAEVWPTLGLDRRFFDTAHLEFHGFVNFLKAGLVFADRLTTVSPRYAQEIRTPEHGHGLDGVLRERRGVLRGILNGIDTTRWDPAHDSFLAAAYDADDLAGKAECKARLQRDFDLPIRARVPLIGMVTRLAEQKGLDILAAALPVLLAEDLQIIVLGRGDERYERWLADAGRRNPTRLAVRLAFDEGLSHHVEAGADAFLMPSRYEPCGLNQMYSLRYGTVPIVRATGGLDDTIDDVDAAPERGTGFKFVEYSPDALIGAVRRALARYADAAAWRRIMREGMRRDHSWRRAALAYLDLYRDAIAGR
ncbi:MAG: glycogen synthase GlgA [Deltaproteobacteria bacterium]|nr:glycogen synthase GlgA [Deltaproteobacteria bacterium]